jgi:penicillin-binding protein-related factor A (putative recombinase)
VLSSSRARGVSLEQVINIAKNIYEEDDAQWLK